MNISKNRLQQLAGIKSNTTSNNKTIKENFRSLGMITPTAIQSYEDISFEEKEECGCQDKDEISEISLNSSFDEIKHIKVIEQELIEQMKVIIGKLETIGDYENLDLAIEFLKSMKKSYDETE